MKVLLCVSQLWNSAAKKVTFSADHVSSWGIWVVPVPLQIHLLTKKTGSSGFSRFFLFDRQ